MRANDKVGFGKRIQGKRKRKKTWGSVRRDPQSSVNECGTGDRDSGQGIAKRKEKSDTERQAGNTEMVYTSFKGRQRGSDLREKSDKSFKEVSSISKQEGRLF